MPYPIPAGHQVLASPTGRSADGSTLIPYVVATPQPSEIEQTDGVWPFLRRSDGLEFQFRPPPAPPATVYRLLTANQVIDLIVSVIGAAAFIAAWNDANLALWQIKMRVARDITKAQAETGLTAIVSAGHMTAAQRMSILNAWPAL